jgi:hypothetical protein
VSVIVLGYKLIVRRLGLTRYLEEAGRPWVSRLSNLLADNLTSELDYGKIRARTKREEV